VKRSCELGNEHSDSNKMLGNYRVAAQLVASLVVFRSTELLIFHPNILGWASFKQ
jgi:hypothetical protein